MRKYFLIIIVAVCVLAQYACEQEVLRPDLFELLNNEDIGMAFSNDLEYDPKFNVYKYRNFYNGGGVAIGDINNDGWSDIYLTANQLENKLYLNKGDWTFEDITLTSATSGSKAWSTGVSMVDINADGHMDIYVCNSGDLEGDNKENELFINNGDLTFTEAAAQYGLNDKGYSTHAAFFDFDKDGDLDVYILNNSYQAIGSFNLRKNERPNRDELGGDKLMRNDDGVFHDVSEAAGIYGSVIGFGLGVTVGDLNKDGWEDIFISNDFFERDYLYLNQGDGTFKEDLESQIRSISGASMGADMADIDNDGYNDIFVTEMLPSSYDRLKTVTTFENWNKYQYNVRNGYHHQYTRNVLHHNNGNSTFSEIGRMAGVEASDWSWGALFFDMDNDGFKDLYIANGIYKDLTNQDYLEYVANEEVIKSVVQDSGVNYEELVTIIPSNPVPNHAYRNLGGLQFEDFDNSGLKVSSFSNGAAYGDLDNDGDLDLVVNNVNMPLFVHKNNATNDNGYIKLKLKGEGKNPNGIGAQIKVFKKDEVLYFEQQPARGFQSSMDLIMNIGLGESQEIDIQVKWPLGKVSTIQNITPNTLLTIRESEAQLPAKSNESSEKKVFKSIPSPIDYVNKEANYVDFNQDRLIYTMRSNEGPKVAYGDVDGDQISDIIIPGAKGASCLLYRGAAQGSFQPEVIEALEQFKDSEFNRCQLLDIDGDNDLDIYMASGGVEVSKYSEYLIDRILINDGLGNFIIDQSKLPTSANKISTGALSASDIDHDGDMDLFIGERIKVGSYGAKGSGFILMNDGQGNYTDITVSNAPDLQQIGMITDAQFVDIDSDGDDDLVVVGEFMSPQLLLNDQGQFRKTQVDLFDELKGWWNDLHVVDLNQDGKLDLVMGNHGLNSRLRGTVDHPMRLYYSDFDKNGTHEGIITFNAEDGKDYPYALRHDLIAQLKSIKRKFPTYESFKDASMEDIFDEVQLEEAEVFEANDLRSTILLNKGDYKFERMSVSNELQLSPLFATASGDFDKDGDIDLLMGGNLFNVRPEMGGYDASFGVYLENEGKQGFTFKQGGAGFHVQGEIRDICIEADRIHVIRSRDSVVSFIHGPE